jgi:putative addiction module killer protein
LCYHDGESLTNANEFQIVEYIDDSGVSPFGEWLDVLDATAQGRILIALERMQMGNLANVKGVGDGVLEYRLVFGPGYRIYLDGKNSVCYCCSWAEQRAVKTKTSNARSNTGKRISVKG